MRILTVEDDELLAQKVANVLSQQHYAVDVAPDGEIGWQFAIATAYDLILLDVMLPKLDGVSLCRQLRQAGYQMPILLLTAKDSGTDKVIGLDAGADDYVVKPIDFAELGARIRAVLRRGHTASFPLLTWASLSLDPGSLEVTYDNQPVHLTSTEHRLLELFLRNPQRIFSRSAIVEHLWAFDDQPEASTIKTYIKNLRQKLKAVGASADLIETVYGLGYRLKPEIDRPNTTEFSSPDLSFSSAERSLKERQALLAVTKARDSFKTQIQARLNILKQAVEAMEAETLSIELYEQAVHEAHRFAGALGTFGFATASELAEAIEDLLQVQPFSSHQTQQIRQLVDQLAQNLEQSLNQTGRIEAIDLPYPQLSVISKDKQWIQSLIHAACDRPITVKSVFVSAESEWVKQTLHLVQAEHSDVVLLDLDAASISQTMALLSELSKRIAVPVLVIVKSDNFEQRIEAARRGGRRFLLKTVSAHQVLEQAVQVLQYIQTGEARILIVNDDRQTLGKIRDILEPWGLQLKLLIDPKEFWKALTTFLPNLLVLDAEMPNSSGIDLCRVIRTDPNWSRLPILFLTSGSDTERIHQLFAIGADDCIAKPIAGAKLLTRILNRLARSQWRT
ncbi:response regulator [Microcoleus sp. FACHB-1515]|uniref:response regulator n=1 Tax=Cyanophyceae TaxID=3028117 RepID=UPI001689F46F|nr:response regulator [Microcoleus sp. FACHB-1515]MBD2090504.1 response regulator [Microcoleus sp. FACHB-1515]